MNKAEFYNFLSRNGFLWGPESNPYGVSGFMSYGPVGKKLKSNIEREFRSIFQREGFDEIETPILYPQKAWEASGHLSKFNEEMFSTQTSRGQMLQARPEIATTIYPLFRRLLEYYRGKMPFKVYQMGIVLPNDRQTEWQIRTRQYTAHEGHIFFDSRQVSVPNTITYLEDLSLELMGKMGIYRNGLTFREKTSSERPFYAKMAYGLYVTRENGEKLELLGVQYRSFGDFEKHSNATGVSLKIGNSYPEVFEISFSTDRPFLVILEQALKKIRGRAVLQLPDHLAPIPAVIFPLKNTQSLCQQAVSLSEVLRRGGFEVPIMEQGDIGRRYRRADALGVPYVFTIDEASLKDNSFTLRERDAQIQVRVNVSDVTNLLPSFQLNTNIADLSKKLFDLGRNRGT